MKKILALTLAMILVCLTVCSCSSSDETKKNFKVGETAKIDDVSITLTDVSESHGGDFFGPDEGNVFVLCEFNIENNSDEELTISSILCFETYFDDYEADISISALTASEKDSLDGTIAPGKKMSGVIGYEVSADWKNVEIHYTPNIIKDDKIIFVAEK